MAGTTITPTRMVLNQLKGRLKTARRGHKLLKDKRDELMRQFMDVVKRNKQLRIRVEDGLTAAWQYANSDLSGNAATLSLQLDGEEIYKSDALKPGEVIDSITLSKPLEPGTYQAMAVTTVDDADGEVQLVSRVPVTLNVAG